MPDLVEIGAVATGTGDRRTETAFAKRGRQHTPARNSPALVVEHRRGMHDGIRLGRHQRRACRSGGADDVAMRGYADLMGETQNIEDTMLRMVAHTGTAEREPLHDGGQSVRFDEAHALSSGEPGERGRAI